MKNINSLIYVFLILITTLFAEIPETLNYQGYLSENGIAVPDGNYNITFRLYETQSGGSDIWVEEHSGLSTSNGVFSAILGESVDLPDDFSQQYWLGIEYDGSEILPRIQMTSSPYSLASRNVIGDVNIFPSEGAVGIGTTDFNDTYSVNIFTDDTNSDDPNNAGISMRTNETPEGRHGLTLSATSDENASLVWSGNSVGGGALNIKAGYGSAMHFSLDPEKDGNYENWLTLSQGLNSVEFYKDVNVDGSIEFTGNLTKNGNLIEFENALWNTAGDATVGSVLNYNYDSQLTAIGSDLQVTGKISVINNNRIDIQGEVNGESIRYIGEAEYFRLQTSGSGIQFEPDYANSNPVMTITSEEQIGIGTTMPYSGSKLHLYHNYDNSDINATFLISSNLNSGEGQGMNLTSALDQHGYFSYSDDEGDLFITASNWIHIGDNDGDDIMTLNDNGNVGIGMNPNYELDVDGDINFSGNLLQNGNLVEWGDNTLWNTTGDTGSGSNLHYDYGGYVGIGTEPGADWGRELHIHSTTNADLHLTNDLTGPNGDDGATITMVGDGSGIDMLINNREAGNLLFYTNGTEKIRIESDGNVGIGMDEPNYELDVDGTIRGDNVSPSDLRYKTNIKSIQKSLQKVKQLQGVYYDWKDKSKDPSRQIGFIAQDVEKIFPELVKTDDDGYKSMNYSKMVSILVESVKDLDNENQKLEDRISKLENTIEMLLDEASIDRINK